MSYGRIRRGPMAADNFTQIRNAVFRDVRLSAKAMGIFGNISTHRDGWGVSAESIASQMKDGVAAVKAGLRELEEHGYLRRTRRRNPDGTLGSSVYFITDQPEALPEPPALESPRSEPAVDYPPVANPPVDDPPEVEPPVAEPTVVNHPHKNTNSKHTSFQNTLSSRLPDQQAQEPPAPVERETDASQDKLTTAQRIVRASGVVTAEDEQQFIAWVRAKHPPAGPQFWRTVSENGDLPELAATWHAQRTQATAPRPSGVMCACCNTIAPVACTYRGKPYCAACTATCASCQEQHPEDQLDHGECHPCRTARSPAA